MLKLTYHFHENKRYREYVVLVHDWDLWGIPSVEYMSSHKDGVVAVIGGLMIHQHWRPMTDLEKTLEEMDLLMVLNGVIYTRPSVDEWWSKVKSSAEDHGKEDIGLDWPRE